MKVDNLDFQIKILNKTIALRGRETYLFTSESVAKGHPDKVCDQISDAIVDAVKKQDPTGRTAVECFIQGDLLVIGGEINTTATIDAQEIAKQVLRDIGYGDPQFGFDVENANIIVNLVQQSSDIAHAVSATVSKKLGAGDQGLMFGFACQQTPEYMPAPIVYAHELLRSLEIARTTGVIKHLGPDAKSQVTIEYHKDDQTIKRIHTVVISTQHTTEIDNETLRRGIIGKVVKKVLPTEYLDEQTIYHINPSDNFVKGGPAADTGLTGRKIIVDTYGGWGRHGGGAFSGKDCTKVDRSAAYMARYVAKQIVAAGLADEIEIQLSYAIGYHEPLSININTQGTHKISEEQIIHLIQENFDLEPGAIIERLELTKPIFQQTAALGHFGRPDLDLPWEKLDMVETLQEAAQKHGFTPVRKLVLV